MKLLTYNLHLYHPNQDSLSSLSMEGDKRKPTKEAYREKGNAREIKKIMH